MNRRFPKRVTQFSVAAIAATLVLLSGILMVFAQDGTEIRIDAIDAENFPTVSVEFSVLDRFGAPITGLTAPDFQVFEDGQKVSAGALRMEPVDINPVSLVLAVDLSTEPADLDTIKTGLLTLVDRMRPTDQVVLLSFFDQVRLEQAPTYDKDVIRAAINRLGVEGNFTALNQVVVDAFDWADRLDEDRRAVVIVTDSVENIGSLPVDQVFARTDQADTPAYLIAFSPKSQPADSMESFGLRIKARPTVVNTATEAALRLQSLSLFDRTYRLLYTSALPAERGDFTLSINLTALGAVVRSDTNLRTQAGSVEIALPVENGAEIGGILPISPQIDAPGPVTQVEFLVDGQVMSVLNNPPFDYEWDSTQVQPGSHVIGVRARDSAGNQGESYATVSVVTPLQIRASTTRAEPQVGEEVTVVADVQSVAGVERVSLLLNGLTAGTLTQSPYIFTFDTEGYTPGTQRISVQAVDQQGYSETVDFSIDLVAPPPQFLLPVPVWLRIFALSSIVLSLFLTYLLLVYLFGLARRRSRRRFQMELENLGNQLTSYLLRADDPRGALRYQFSQNGILLKGREERIWERVPQEEVAELMPPRQYLLPAPVSLPMAAGAQQAGNQQGGNQQGNQQAGNQQGDDGQGGPRFKAPDFSKVQQAGQKVGVVARLAGGFASLLSVIAVIIPARFGGNALRSAATSIRKVYFGATGVQRAQNVAGQLGGGGPGGSDAGRQEFFQQANAKRMQAMREQRDGGQQQSAGASQSGGSGGAGGKMPAMAMPQFGGGAGQATATASPGGSGQNGSSANGMNGHGAGAPVGSGGGYAGGYGGGYPGSYPAGYAAVGAAGALPAGYKMENGTVYRETTRRVDDAWVETRDIAPGDSLFLEMQAQPRGFQARRKRHTVRLVSRAIKDESQALKETEIEMNMPGSSWLFGLLLPLVVLLLGIAISLFMLAYLLTDLGLLSPETLPFLSFLFA